MGYVMVTMVYVMRYVMVDCVGFTDMNNIGHVICHLICHLDMSLYTSFDMSFDTSLDTSFDM